MSRPMLRWLPALCVLRLVDSNLSYGQINLFVFAVLLEGAHRWAHKKRRSAGFWLGLAAAIKVLPAFLFLQLALARRWRSLATAALTAVGLVILLPVPWLGWEASWGSLLRWWTDVAGPYRAGGAALLEQRPYLAGQGLSAALYRALTPIAASGGPDGPRANFADIDPDSVRLLVWALSAMLVALFIASVSLRPSREATRGWLIEFSMALAIALLLGPLVHKAHMVWMLLPITLLWSGLAPEAPNRWRAAQGVLFAFTLLSIGATTPALVGRDTVTWLMERNVLCLGMLALVAALALERWAPPASVAEGEQ